MLPKELSHAVERLLSSNTLKGLKAARHHVTESYHDLDASRHLSSETERLSYLATRMPATYAAARRVFEDLLPHYKQIASLLDLGAGPGTVFWAAKDLFSLSSATFFEQDSALLELGKKLLEDIPDLPPLTTRVSSLYSDQDFPPHDLVTLSYVLNELDDLSHPEILQKAWEASKAFFVLIEPGTPRGYDILMEARETLLGKGANLLSPCPHQHPCPLKEGDWCHFSVRLERPKFHRIIKEAFLPYEDEKYSYLVFSRHVLNSGDSRVIKRPLLGSGHVTLDLCTRDGLERRIISKRHKEDYKRAKKISWGQTFNLKNDEEY